METKAERIEKLKGLLKMNNGKTFLRNYKDNVIEYKIKNNNLHCYSELFFQWKKDNLETWSEEQLRILIKNLGGK